MSPALVTRRDVVVAAAATTVLAACATGPKPADLPPIVFVHGNGDTAGLWLTTIWRNQGSVSGSRRAFAPPRRRM